MTINRNSYEVYIIDFLDGRLNHELKDELIAFMAQNPDIAAEVDGIADLKLNPSNQSIPLSKHLLKRSTKIGDSNISEADYLCIAALEGDLSPAEAKELDSLLESDPTIKQLYKTYEKTQLTPISIKFPKPHKLKRGREISFYTKVSIAAASIAAVALIAIYLNSTSVKTNNPFMVANQHIESQNNPQVLPDKGANIVASSEHRPETKPNSILHNTANKKVGAQTDATKTEVSETSIRESIEPLKSLAPQIAQQIQNSQEIDVNSLVSNGTASKNHTTDLRLPAKEYNLTDLAFQGLKKLARSAGIEIDVKQNEAAQTKKIVVESRLLAVSATILPKEE